MANEAEEDGGGCRMGGLGREMFQPHDGVRLKLWSAARLGVWIRIPAITAESDRDPASARGAGMLFVHDACPGRPP